MAHLHLGIFLDAIIRHCIEVDSTAKNNIERADLVELLDCVADGVRNVFGIP